MNDNVVIAPVKLLLDDADSVSHSLKILASIYNYNHWLFSSIRDYLGTSVLEVGASIGNITRFLLNVEELVCLEPFKAYEDSLITAFAAHSNVKVYSYAIEDCPNSEVKKESFDTVICLNVLEHIEDDKAVLMRMKQSLQIGGKLIIIIVPALPLIYGEIDAAMGHVRRYTRRSLRKKFDDVGFECVASKYINFVGVLGWWFQGRMMKRDIIPEKATRFFDKCVPYFSAIERLIPPCIGQSLLMVGQKVAEDE